MNWLYINLFWLQMQSYYSHLQAKYDIAPGTSTLELMTGAELWVISMDFLLEFPRPLQPNVILIAHSSIGLNKDQKVSSFADN